MLPKKVRGTLRWLQRGGKEPWGRGKQPAGKEEEQPAGRSSRGERTTEEVRGTS